MRIVHSRMFAKISQMRSFFHQSLRVMFLVVCVILALINLRVSYSGKLLVFPLDSLELLTATPPLQAIENLKLNQTVEIMQPAENIVLKKFNHLGSADLDIDSKLKRSSTALVREKVHPQFVFLMGTEGSGHHLWSSLIEQSPVNLRLQKLGLMSQAEEITWQLFSKDHLDKSLFAGSACHPNWNGTYLVHETARKLRLTAEKLPRNMTVPLNGLMGAKSKAGMISYPNFREPANCTGFRFPDVRLLHQACQLAQVSCHVILQYRDPLATLRSTTIRRKLHSIGFAIALYTSMYAALSMQLAALSPESLQACWEFDDAHPSAQLGMLLGYDSELEFRTAFGHLFIKAKKVNQEDVVPAHLDVPMRSLMEAYELMKLKCLEILEG